MSRSVLLLFIIALTAPAALAGNAHPKREPLVRVVDLNAGESTVVTLCDGSQARVKLVHVVETRDDVCFAVRRAEVSVEVNGQTATIVSATYNLPTLVGGVQIEALERSRREGRLTPACPRRIPMSAHLLTPADSGLTKRTGWSIIPRRSPL